MLYLVLWVCLSSGMTIDWLQSAHLPFQGVGLSSFTFVHVSFLLKQLLHCLAVKYFSLVGMKKLLESGTDGVFPSMAGRSLRCLFFESKAPGPVWVPRGWSSSAPSTALCPLGVLLGLGTQSTGPCHADLRLNLDIMAVLLEMERLQYSFVLDKSHGTVWLADNHFRY